jgi:hypothetical protein
VLEKDRSNYCDFFAPGSRVNAAAEKDKLLSAAEALFGGSGGKKSD